MDLGSMRLFRQQSEDRQYHVVSSIYASVDQVDHVIWIYLPTQNEWHEQYRRADESAL